MTALSFPVICGVVLVVVFQSFTPVLPSVTPDFDIELHDGEPKDSLLYESVPYSSHANRLKRQVTLPPTSVDEPVSVFPDKRLLNKNPSAATNTKKVFDVKSAVLPTSRPLDPSTNVQDGTGQSLPTQSENGNGLTRGDITSSVPFDGSNQEGIDQPFSDEDVLFDGNSTYPHLPQNNTYYDNKHQNYSLKKVSISSGFIVTLTRFYPQLPLFSSLD